MKRLADYSQHFIRTPALIKELVGHSTISKHDQVIDIGAGSGTITSVLATRAKSVIAVELEPRIINTLRDNMSRFDNVTILEGDFLTMKLPNTPYKIFANIPFHLSSPIVHTIVEAKYPPVAAYLIVQKQFANKLLPDYDGFTGQLGMAIGPQFAVRIRKKLQRTDYMPQPNVDTVMIELAQREQPLVDLARMTDYRRFIVDCFSTPRIFAKMPIRQIGLAIDIKPSQMRLVQWIALFDAQRNY
jgi:23S rRNA (adenine-N6)-dimethyltransferase